MTNQISLGQSSLQINLIQGETKKLNFEFEAEILQEIGGVENSRSSKESLILSFFVHTVTDTGYIVKLSFEKIYSSLKGNNFRMESSSYSEDSKDIYSNILKQLLKHQFDLTLTKFGRVTNVTGITSAFNSAVASSAQLSIEQQRKIVFQLEELLGEKPLRMKIESALHFYPENPVKKGETWTIVSGFGYGDSVLAKTVYEYKEITDNRAQIFGVSIISSIPDIWQETHYGYEKRNLSGTMNSKLTIDKNTGWPISISISRNFSGTVTVKAFEDATVQVPSILNYQNKITYSDK